jgi:hypothetical protein
MDANQELQTRVAIATGMQEPPAIEPDGSVSKIVVGEGDKTFDALQRYYGVEEMDSRTRDQLQDVLDYYKELKTDADTGDILKLVREAHLNMVQPEVGQTKLSQLADYVRIIREMESSKKQKQAYERFSHEDSSVVDRTRASV